MHETVKTKTDCFAYRGEKPDCAVMYARDCDSGECPFYKTKEQFDEDACRAKIRYKNSRGSI